MVADTQQHMNGMFAKTAEQCRAAMDTGFGAQQAWLNACGDFFKRTGEMGTAVPNPDKFAGEFGPFLGKTVEAMTECADTGFRANMTAFKTVCDAGTRTDAGDVYGQSREIMDATFAALKTNLDAFGKIGKRTADNFTAFCSAACCQPKTASGKGPEKASK